MAHYAENTKVSPERTRAEIEETLRRFGCDQFVSGWADGVARLGFRVNGRMYRFELEIPTLDSVEVTRTETGKVRRGFDALQKKRDQLERQRWRALLLVIKGKIEAVQSGIVSFEDEFLSATVMANGRTFGQWANPQIAEMYATGAPPALLWDGPGGES